MKKKVVVLLVVLSLLLVGCGGKTAETDVSGKVEPMTEPVVQEEQPTEPSVAEEQPEETPVTMGRMEGGAYINEYAGYSCTLDSNWAFYGAEELQALPDNVKELLEDTEIGDSMETITQFTDMMAENANEMLTMNVLYQKIGLQERLAFAMLSESEVIDATLEEKASMIDAYAQAGMDVETLEKVKVTFLGEERTGLKTTGTIQGMPFYILQVFDFHLGQYTVTLSVNSYMEDKTAQTLELFQPIN